MKIYKKPTLEVISMKTSENIAANNIIKTVYVRAAQASGYVVDQSANTAYDPYADMNGSGTPYISKLQG